MEKYFTGIHGKDCKVVQYDCMCCGEQVFTIAEIKGKGISKCSLCGNNHQITTFKSGRITVINKGLE